jgi:hypothetical protein
MRSPKTPQKYFLKSDLKISKNLNNRPDFVRIPSPERGQKRGRELQSARQLRGK